MEYNGWKNYCTWRVNLEYFDEGHITFDEEIRANRDVSDLAAILREYVEDHLEQEGDGQVLSYALAFLQECSYYQIADHMIQEWEDMHCTNCNEEIDGYDEYCSKKCRDEYELLATHPKG